MSAPWWLDVGDKVASVVGAVAGVAGLVIGTLVLSRDGEQRGSRAGSWSSGGAWRWLAMLLGGVAMACGVLRVVSVSSAAGGWAVSLAGLVAGGGCVTVVAGVGVSRGWRMSAHPVVRRLVAAQWEDAFRHQYDFVLGSAPPLDEIYVEQKADVPLSPGEIGGFGAAGVVTLREMLAGSRHAVIVADPGTGKSTALARIASEQCAWWKDAWLFARSGRAPYGAVVPVLLPAAALAVRGLPEALAERCRQVTGLEVDREFFERRPPLAKHWLVLVDGVDQVLTTWERSRLLTLLGNRVEELGSPYRFVVATRPLAFGELGMLSTGGAGRFSLRRFDTDDLEAFAHRWADYRSRIRSAGGVGALTAEMFLARVAAARLAAIARVPLLATIAALLLEVDGGRELPGSRTELYERCVQHLLYGRGEMLEQRRVLAGEFARHGEQGELAWTWLENNLIRLLEGVAEAYLSAGDTGILANAENWVRHHAPPGMFETVTGWERHLRVLLEASGVVVFRAGGAEFLHQSFAEYLAAGPRAGRFERDAWLADVRSPDSRNLALFVLGRSRYSADPLVSLLLEQRAGDVCVAGEIVADGVRVSPGLRTRVIAALVEQVTAEEWTSNEALHVLTDLASDPAVRDTLVGIALDPGQRPWVRVFTADALCDVGRDGIAVLRQVFLSTSAVPEEVRRWAARRLVARDAANPSEVDYLDLDDPTAAGSGLETAQACQRLVEDRRSEPRNRLRAALALAGAGETLTDQFGEILADQRLSQDARLDAAWALAQLGDPDALQQLEVLARDEGTDLAVKLPILAALTQHGLLWARELLDEMADAGGEKFSQRFSSLPAWREQIGVRSFKRTRQVDQVPSVWGDVPPRNPYFTGRENYLKQLREKLTTQKAVVLHGLGGLGKTQLAVEYAYRHAADYQLVWWVPADQNTLVLSTLAALAPHLGLDSPLAMKPPESDGASSTNYERHVEDTAKAVINALSRSQPYDRWLLIFNQCDRPEDLAGLLPHGPGHVLVTSRNHRWASMHVASIMVDVFDRPESHMFLRRRIPGITADDSDHIAHQLGDVPVALDQAGALQGETGMPQNAYLEQLEKQVHKFLEQTPYSEYPISLTANWDSTVARLRTRAPHATELLRLYTFLGPEPIPFDLLRQGAHALQPPLKEALGDPVLLRRAVSELSKYGLAQVDNNRKTLQVDRLTMALVRCGLTEHETSQLYHHAHLLLAAADPGEPDNLHHDARYTALLAHVDPADIWSCPEPLVRRLALHIVRYLHIIGNHSAAVQSADRALETWTTDSGHDHPDVLTMSTHKAEALAELRQRDVQQIAPEKVTDS